MIYFFEGQDSKVIAVDSKSEFSKVTEEINIKIVETNNWTRITSPKDLK